MSDCTVESTELISRGFPNCPLSFSSIPTLTSLHPGRRRPNHDALASPLEEGVSVGSDVFPGVSVPVLASPRSSDAFLPTPAAVGNDSPLSPVSTNSDSANSHPNSAFSTLNTDGSAGSHSARGLAIISSVASQPITMHLTKGVYGKNPSSSQPGLQEVESAELVLLRKIGSGQYGKLAVSALPRDFAESSYTHQ